MSSLIFRGDDEVELYLPRFDDFDGMDLEELVELRNSLVSTLVKVERELDKQGFFQPPVRYITENGTRHG